MHLENALCRTIRLFIRQQNDRVGNTVVTQKFLRYSKSISVVFCWSVFATSARSFKVIPLKLFHFQTFLETWRDKLS